MLKKWIRQRNKILLQKKGPRRARGGGVGTKDQMEDLLEKVFEDAKAQGRQVTHRWFTRHAKVIYRELYSHHVDSRYSPTLAKVNVLRAVVPLTHLT